MSIAPQPPPHTFFWVLLAWSLVSLLISKICLWRAAWHLKECSATHRRGDILLEQIRRLQIQQLEDVSIPVSKETRDASPEAQAQ